MTKGQTTAEKTFHTVSTYQSIYTSQYRMYWKLTLFERIRITHRMSLSAIIVLLNFYTLTFLSQNLLKKNNLKKQSIHSVLFNTSQYLSVHFGVSVVICPLIIIVESLLVFFSVNRLTQIQLLLLAIKCRYSNKLMWYGYTQNDTK